jgi:taurine dioxygenase
MPAPFEVTPLTPTIGAEITGVKLGARLSDGAFEAIQDALFRHQVLFFREQKLSPSSFLAFARRFGPVTPHPSLRYKHAEHEELAVVRADETSQHVFGLGWHADQTAQETPPLLSMLYLTEAPALGGDTLWSSMYAAYDALSEPMKAFLATLTAAHNSLKPLEGYIMGASRNMIHNEHPVITRHPVTGRPSIFVNRTMTTNIPQLRWAESEALLSFLYQHAEAPRFQCRFRWTADTVAIWDNRSTQHTVVWDYAPQVRQAVRATVEGPRPAPFAAVQTARVESGARTFSLGLRPEVRKR